MAKKQRKKSEGLGDTIEKVLEVTGAKKLVSVFVDGKDCGCNKRKVSLNKTFSYRMKPRCFTEAEYKQWKATKDKITLKTLRADTKQIDYICTLHSEVMNRQYFKPPVNGSIKSLIDMVDNINIVYDSYK